MSFPTDGFTVVGATAYLHAVNNTTLDETIMQMSFTNMGGTDAEYAAIQAAIEAIRDSLLTSTPGSDFSSSIRYQSQIVG